MTVKQAARLMLVREDGTFLVVNRPRRQDVLCLPGGKVEPEEDLVTAAVRETWEETGVRVPPEALVALFTGRVANDQAHDQDVYEVTTFVGTWDDAWGMPQEMEPGLRPRWVEADTFVAACMRPDYDGAVIQAWRQATLAEGDTLANHPRRASRSRSPM